MHFVCPHTKSTAGMCFKHINLHAYYILFIFIYTIWRKERKAKLSEREKEWEIEKGKKVRVCLMVVGSANGLVSLYITVIQGIPHL